MPYTCPSREDAQGLLLADTTGRMVDNWKSALHWSDGIALPGANERREEDILPTLDVEALDDTLLEVLEAILPLLQATTRDRKRKRNINGAIEQLKSVRVTKGRAANEDAWIKDGSCLEWSSCAE